MTKKELIDTINSSTKVYGKSELGWSLAYNFCNIGFYQEDKRRSKIQFAIECVNNCYTGGITEENYRYALNKEIELAVKRALEFCATAISKDKHNFSHIKDKQIVKI